MMGDLSEGHGKDAVSLAVAAEDELMGADIFKPALRVESASARIVFPDAEPKCIGAEFPGDAFDLAHQTLCDAAAFPLFIDVEAQKLDRRGSVDAIWCGMKS